MKKTFSKEERLHSRTAIQALFKSGKSFAEYPLRVRWMFDDSFETPVARVVIIVPKQNMKRSVDRNLLKRRIREAYRIHRGDLLSDLEAKQRKMTLAILYTAKEILPFDLIQDKIILILQRLKHENEKVTE